jgi:hypothetical protein
LSKTIVITGMHRSGTSLVASLFERAGLHVGDELLPADPSNPRGFFEDVEFLRFHEEALHARGLDFVVREPLAFVPTPVEVEWARTLVAKRSDRDLWGWKDPRTSLFLPFWKEELNEAQFVFIYRHPVDVLCSLVRRRTFAVADLTSALETWHTYNRSILDFFLANRDRSVLLDVYALVNQPAAAVQVIGDRLGIAPTEDDVAASYGSRELRRIVTSETASATNAVLADVHPLAAQLFAELEAAADVAPSSGPGTGPSGAWKADVALTALDPGSETTRHVQLALLVSHLDEAPLRRFWHDFPLWARELEVAVGWNARRAAAATTAAGESEEAARQAEEAVRAAHEAELTSIRSRLRDALDQLAALRNDYAHLLTVDVGLRDKIASGRARDKGLRREVERAQEQRRAVERELDVLLRTRVVRLGRMYWAVKARVRRLLRRPTPSPNR